MTGGRSPERLRFELFVLAAVHGGDMEPGDLVRP
jgi:hypothetical protein